METSESDTDSSSEPVLLLPRSSRASTNLLAHNYEDSDQIQCCNSDDEILLKGSTEDHDPTPPSESVVAALNLEGHMPTEQSELGTARNDVVDDIKKDLAKAKRGNLKFRRYSVGARPLGKTPHVSFNRRVKLAGADISSISLNESFSDLDEEPQDLSETNTTSNKTVLFGPEEGCPAKYHIEVIHETVNAETEHSCDLRAAPSDAGSKEKQFNNTLPNPRSRFDGSFIVSSLSATNAALPESPSSILITTKSDSISDTADTTTFHKISSDPSLLLFTSGEKEESMSETRRLIVEKELLESKFRILQLKNFELHNEVSLAKEKLSQAVAANTSLKISLDALRNENNLLKCSLGEDELNIHEQHRKHVAELENKIKQYTENLRAAETEIDVLRKRLGYAEKAIDHNKLLRNELDRTREKLRECTMYRHKDTAKLNEASVELLKLRRENTMLKQELESSFRRFLNESQVVSVQKRVCAIEHRLQQEHADRATKLSDVETRLITENAKLLEFKSEYDNLKLQIEKYQEALEDVRHERDELQKQLNREIESLTTEKHQALAKAKYSEDLKDAISAENEYLKKSLNDIITDDNMKEVCVLSHELADCRQQLEIKKIELQQEREKVASLERCLKAGSAENTSWNHVSVYSIGKTTTCPNEAGTLLNDTKVHKKECSEVPVSPWAIHEDLDPDFKQVAVELNINKEMIQANYREINILMDALNSQNEEVRWIRKHIDDLMEQNKQCRLEIDLFQKEITEKIANISNAKFKEVLSREQTKLEAEYNKLQRLLQMQTAELEREKANLHASKSAIESMTGIKEMLERINKHLEQTVSSLRNKILEETRSKSKHVQEADMFRSELVRCKKEMTVLETKVRMLQGIIKEQKAELDSEKEQNKGLKKELSKAKELNKMKARHSDSLEITIAQQQEKISQLQSQLKTQQQYFNDIIRQLKWKCINKCNNCSQTEMLYLQREKLLSRDLQSCQQDVIAKNKLILTLKDQNYSLNEQLKEATQRAQLAQVAFDRAQKRCEWLEKNISEYLESKFKLQMRPERERNKVIRVTPELKQYIQAKLVPIRYNEFDSRALLHKLVDHLNNQVVQLEYR